MSVPSGEAPASPAPVVEPVAPAPAPVVPAPAPEPVPAPAPVAPAPALALVPEQYDIKLPEGALLDAKHVETVSVFAKEQKLTNDQAQGILKRDNDLIKADRDAIHAKMVADCQAELAADYKTLENDKDVGGPKLAENADLVQKFLVKAFGEADAKLISNYGTLGNKPGVFKGLLKLAQQFSNDKIVLGGGSAAPPAKSMAEKWYGKKESA